MRQARGPRREQGAGYQHENQKDPLFGTPQNNGGDKPIADLWRAGLMFKSPVEDLLEKG
jgi:hypothetical protein